MSVRNEIVKEALATESRWRALGYDINGLPALMGEVDFVGAWMSLQKSSADRNNRLQLEHWPSDLANIVGLSGSIGYTGLIPVNSSLLIEAWVDGIANDYSEGYGAKIISKWRRGAAGAAVQVGVTTKLFEVKDQAGATSSFANTGNGSLYINFDSGQVAKQYNWQINALYTVRKYA